MLSRGASRLTITLDFQTGLPAYLQIVRQIEGQIANGHLLPGQRLPTVRELAVLLGVNFNTVARAYRLLHRSRAVSAQQGRGTFVLAPDRRAKSAAIALQALAAQYIAAARRSGCRNSQILTVVAQRLRASAD